MDQCTITKQILSYFLFVCLFWPGTALVAGDTEIHMTLQPGRQPCTYVEGKDLIFIEGLLCAWHCAGCFLDEHI